MKHKIGDLFCGTGGFSHGFVQTGAFEVAFGIDIRRPSSETFAANHRDAIPICDDIRTITPSRIAERIGTSKLDIIIGGPPCQGFSSIRPFRSINENDHRNNLFEQFVLYVGFFRPRYVVLENVVGMVRHNNGRTLTAIRQALESLGYSVEVAVLNAVNFGLPQKRERVIVVGSRGKRKPPIPEITHAFNGRSMAGKGMAVKPLPLFSRDLSPALTVRDAIYDLPEVEAGAGSDQYRKNIVLNDYVRARRNQCKVLTLHSSTQHTPRMLEIIRKAGTNRWALPSGMTTSGFSSCYSRLTLDEPSTTITVNFVHPASNRCIHPTQDRALTPREGARLQGFDDSFVFCGSRTEIVKQIGEAVPPLLGRAIALSLLKQT
jgi:DNA (cytosine-5)-methyltransferase 1